MWRADAGTALDLLASKIAFGSADWHALTDWEIIAGSVVLGGLMLTADSQLHAAPIRLRCGRLDAESISEWLGQAMASRGAALGLAAETDFEAIAQRLRYGAAHFEALTEWLLRLLPPLIRETHLLGRQDLTTRLLGIQALTTRLLGRADLITRARGRCADGGDWTRLHDDQRDTHKLVFEIQFEGEDATLEGATLRWGWDPAASASSRRPVAKALQSPAPISARCC